MTSLIVERYKDRVLLRGSETDTLAIKDLIKQVEGRHYNANLRDENKNRFKAWTFPLDKKYEVEKIVNDYQESLKPKPKPKVDKPKKVKPNQKDFVTLHLIGSFVITKSERKKFKREGYDFRKKSDQHEMRKIIRSRRADITL